MARHRLLGIGSSTDFTQAVRDQLAALGITSFGVGDLVGFSSKKREKLGVFGGKSDVMKQVLQNQQELEAIIGHGDLLPAAFDTVFNGNEDIIQFLTQNTELLRQALVEFGQYRQFQIMISWQKDRMLQKLKSAMQHQSGTADMQATSKNDVARIIQNMTETIRVEVFQEIEKDLRSVCQDIAFLPVDDPAAIGNYVCLIKGPMASQKSLSVFEKKLEEIDKRYEDGLHIRMLGPLPPITFATIKKEDIEQSRIKKALRALNIEKITSSEQIKEAYHRYMKTAHPDTGGDTNDASSGTAAYALLKCISEQALDADLSQNDVFSLCRIEKAEAA